MCSDPPAWKQLISYPLPTQERIPLIASIFSDHIESKVVGYLSGDDAQTFVDMVDEVKFHSEQWVGWLLLKLLHGIN